MRREYVCTVEREIEKRMRREYVSTVERERG